MGSSEFVVAILSIVVINLVLSGDNAVVIALACRNLSGRQQNLGIIWGTVGAVVLRVLLTVVAAYLLTLPYLQIIGGLLLLWIGIKLLAPGGGEEEVEAADGYIAAIKTIIFADLIMSLDNVLGVAAAARGNITLLVFGLLLSIPIVVFGSKLMLKLMERWPVIIYVGAGVIGYTAGEMLIADRAVTSLIHGAGLLEILIPAVTTIAVIAGGYFKSRASRPVSRGEAEEA